MRLVGEVQSIRGFENKVRIASGVVSNLRPAFLTIASDFYRDEQQVFDADNKSYYEDYKGKRDAEGNTAYMRRKFSKYQFIYPMMTASGALRDSLINPASPGAVRIIDKQRLVLGTSVGYAIFHQSDAARGKMPYRPVVLTTKVKGPLSKILNRRLYRWARIIEASLEKELKRKGAK